MSLFTKWVSACPAAQRLSHLALNKPHRNVFAAFLLMAVVVQAAPDYDRQIESLLSRMTLEEKIGQMVQVDMNALKDKSDVQKYCLGSVFNGADSDPPDKGGQTTFSLWIWPDLLSLPKECHESY
jgi:hypothetical protein